MSPYVFNGNTAINGYDSDGRFGIFAALAMAYTAYTTIDGYQNGGIDGAVYGFMQGVKTSMTTYAFSSLGGMDLGIGTGMGTLANFGASMGANTVLSNVGANDISVKMGDLSISPAFAFGSDVSQVGIAVNYSGKHGGIGLAALSGNGAVTGINGLETRTSGNVKLGNWSFGINDYQSGETSQTNWMAGWSDGTWSAFTENDAWLSGDKYRTAALEVGWNNGHGTTLTAGVKLYTGHTSATGPNPNAYSGKEYINPERNDYLAGIAYGGIRTRGQNLQFGHNSEGIRHIVQNRIAHDYLMRPFGGSPWIPTNPHLPSSHYFNYSSYSPYSLY